MAKLGRVIIAGVVAVCVCRLWPTTFVPAPAQRRAAELAAAAAVLGAAPPAFADKIDTAAAKLTTAAYPFLKEVNWNDDRFLTLPGATPDAVAKAIAKTLEMGAAMDGKAVKTGVKAHSDAIASINSEGVTSKADFQKINAAIGHMIASAGEAKTMAVFDAWKGLVPSEAPEFLRTTGKITKQDASAAYSALMEFAGVVKAEASLAGAAAPAMRTPDGIDAAAKSLSEAAYPLVKEVNWNADYFAKLPSTDPPKVLQAVKKALDHGAAMDPAYLKEGALAHARAIGKVDANGVLPMDDFVAINSAIGHMFASAGATKSMNTYNAFKGLVSSQVPEYLMSTVNPADAKKAYTALLEFKDVVNTPIR